MFQVAFKKISLLAVVVMMSLVSGQAIAAKSETVAVVNLKIIENSLAHKDFRDKYQAKEKEYRDEILKLSESLKKKKEEIDTLKGKIKPEALEKKNADLRKEEKDAQKFAMEKQYIMEQAKTIFFREIEQETRNVVQEISKEKGYSVVVPKSQTLFSADTIDISDTVLEKLDKNFPKVDIDIEALARKPQEAS